MDELVDGLLRCNDATERAEYLRGQAASVPCLPLVRAIKARADAILRTDPAGARHLGDLAQEVAASAADPLCIATATWCAGNTRFYEGFYEECLRYYHQAIPPFEAAGLSLEAGRLRANCVAVLTDLGRYTEALTEAEIARQTLASQGPTRYLAALEMNTAVLQRHLDDYGAALATCDRGRQIAVALENPVLAGRFDVNRALILENLDSYRTAVATLQETLPVFEEHGETLELARGRLNLGLFYTRLGRYRSALAALEQARQGFAALNNEMEVAVSDWHRAGVYLRLNLLPEAIELYASARTVFAQRGLARQVALADAESAQAHRHIGEAEEALRLLGRARQTLAGQGQLPVQVAMLDVQQAELRLAGGAAESALALAENALNALENGPFPIKRAQARLVLADCYRALGRQNEAERADRETLDVVKPAGLADLTYRAQYGLGQIAEARGDAATALDWYGQATEAIGRASHGLGAVEFQGRFLVDKLAAHQGAVLLSLQRGDVAAAFAYAESARACIGRLLSLDREDNGATPALIEVAREREAWNWHYSRLDRLRWSADAAREAASGRGGQTAPPGAAPDDEEAEVMRELQAVERRLADLHRGTRPADDEGRTVPPFDLAALRARLGTDEALLAWFVARGRVIAFWADAGDVHSADLAAVADLTQELDRLRFTLRRADEATLQILTRLYRMLLAPLAPRLAGHALRRLFIVPYGSLYHVPFHALPDGRGYLLERCEVIYLPSARLLRPGPLLQPHTALILGHDHGGRLPAARQEAQAVHDILTAASGRTGVASRLLLDADASEARLRQSLAGCGILHLATHGVFRQDNPLFSALRLVDGWLTLADVERLALPDAWLVTLSACETGLGDLQGADVFGLSQAFLGAGAASLVVSLWPAPDDATGRLMAEFYRGLVAGQGKAAALRSAQLALLSHPTYRHPLHWAGFVLIGDDGAL